MNWPIHKHHFHLRIVECSAAVYYIGNVKDRIGGSDRDLDHFVRPGFDRDLNPNLIKGFDRDLDPF